MILVDSNVLIDVFDRDPHWFDWSFANIRRATFGAYLFVNPVVAGEVAPRFDTLADFHVAMTAMLLGHEPITVEAAFIAGKAFQIYRHRREEGIAKSILADFFIGGHAQSAKATILTRDPRFYRTYFPAVPLITPETDSA